MNKTFFGSLAAIGLLLSGAVQAVPCGWYGVEPTANCVNGTGLIDSEATLNSGSYFGVSNWTLLDRVNGGDRSDTGVWTVSGAVRGLPAGTATLAGNIWDSYSTLAISLQSGGGAFPVGAPSATQPVYWSLYQLIPGTYLYNWVYGATRSGLLQNIMNVTLYGVAASGGAAITSVAEPGTLSLMLMGMTAIGFAVIRRRRAKAV